MSSFPILDLVVGMIFLFFLLSIICSSAVEMIMTVFKIRAKNLSLWLETIFDKPIITHSNGTTTSLGQAIMDHCTVTALSDKKSSPAYIDAKNFTSALLEKLTYDPSNPNSVATDINSFVSSLQNSTLLSTELKRVFLTYANEAIATFESKASKTESAIDIFQKKIENWYDTSMDRITGNLKTKYSRPFTLIIGILTVVILNADSVSIAKYLYNNPEARIKLANEAYSATKDSNYIKMAQKLDSLHITNANETMDIKQVENDIKKEWNTIETTKATLQNSIPLGWTNNELIKNSEFSGWLLLSKISGLIATVLAIMMGAPFWFDLLNKISNLRGNGTKPTTQSAKDNMK